MDETRREGATVQTLDRGLHVLRQLAGDPGGRSASELAAALEVHRAVVYRLLATLEAHRLVMRGDGGRFRLWTGVLELARGVLPDWRVIAWPELEQLAEALSATAILSVASDDSCVALLVAEPRRAPLHVAYRPGFRHPLTVGASGKAILAGRPPLEGEPADVARARTAGYAVSRGEIQPGATGVAAPIVVDGSAEASVGAVSFADFDSRARRLVVQAAARIAAAFPSESAEVAG